MNNSLFEPDLTARDFLPDITAYYFKQWDDFQMCYHAHNQMEIMYVIEGKCVVETKKKKFTMKKGDFILLDAYVSHRLLVNKDTPCRMLNLEFGFIEQESFFPSIKVLAANDSSFNQFLKMKSPFFVFKDSSDVFHTLKNLVMEMGKRGENSLLVHLLLSQLFIQIARLAVEADINGHQHRANIYVKETISFINQNYDYDVRVKDIALAINLHPGYLQRLFKRYTGSTIIDYLTSVRMDKAKMLLADTEIPVIQISEYVGINSHQYFSSLFKKYTHITPLEFRKTSKKHKDLVSW